MKRNITLIAFLFLAVLCITVTAFGPSDVLKLDGGPPYNTKAPGEKTCSGAEGSSGCHSGGAADDTGPATETITFSGGGQYVPGQTYTVTCTITHPTRNKFGFQIVSLRNSNNANIGTITILDSVRTRSQIPTFGSFQTRNYVMHRINGTIGTANKGEWSYRWVAPSTNVGSITFYACFNAGNNNGQNDGGDETYCTQLTITPGTAGIDEESGEAGTLSIYPNPVKEKLNISLTLNEPSAVRAELFDLQGKLVQTLIQLPKAQGKINEEVKLNAGLAAGQYLVKISAGKKVMNKKIIISE